MDGIITDIQHFSLHDGPGIRTTVFHKGCNMRCAWCHNPETFSPAPQFFHYMEKCTQCGLCAAACPQGALSFANGQLVRRTDCTACGVCEKECLNNAIKTTGRCVSAEWVVEEILRDKAFYAQSGGGVTLSGGEVLLQAAFAAEILTQCKAHGLHTCIESNMSLPFEHIRPVIDLCDMVIMDIKHFNSEKHRQWTGIGNEQVLSNFRRLAEHGTPVVIRTPVVAGVNDSEDDIAAIAQFISGAANLLTYELMPYHSLGENKRKALGMAEGPCFAAPSAAQMELLRRCITHAGIHSGV